MNFDQAFDRLIGHEGGHANHPSDPGGETMWGVTARVARAHGYQGDMRFLPRDTAKAIYLTDYWTPVRADALPVAVRYTVFDAAVNSGVKQTVKWLQRALGVGEDGVMGQLTLSAAQAASGAALVARFNGERLDFMTSLPTWGAFGRGWARRVASELKETT